MDRLFCVYLMASAKRGTLYCGSTSNLLVRVYQHKAGVMPGFTSRHAVQHLVWFEAHGDARAMVVRERQIKEWRRSWKVRLIENANPMWHDLYGQLLGGPSLRE